MIPRIIASSAVETPGVIVTPSWGFSPQKDLVVSDSPVVYPYTTQPDIMVLMSQEAYNRSALDLKPGGTLIIEEDRSARIEPQPG